MSVKFQGSAIKLMGAQGWNHGSFAVDLDGYCCGSGGIPQVIQFEANGLSNIEHVLRIMNLAPGRVGSVLEADALLITPHSGSEYSSHLSLTVFVVLLAVVLAAIRRRRLVRLAGKTSHQMLPLSTPISPSPAPVDTAEERTAGAGEGSGTGGDHAMPPDYASAGPRVDDELVER
ncbi:hypothetical protein DFH07DRAFT_951671 [Mycena maculata]|uniref:Uncharacterized protein n=1 Tax=Mycena maculata TaxID=230809 RepID=A0AAD7NVC0_9AGAR|nr:hypothetical protein DFH07DRAFT_951671 [Mycena maculata]